MGPRCPLLHVWVSALPTAQTIPDRFSGRVLLQILISLSLALTLAWPATAQEVVGALRGTVGDTEGGALPGASVVLEGMGAPRMQVTDSLGGFRFAGLDPGQYRLEARLDGYSMVEHPQVGVRIGQSTTIEIQLPAMIGDVITVVTEVPLLDERNFSTGIAVPSVELDTIPTTRNPWALLDQVPGVLTDRVNVGGSESGYQTYFRAPGTERSANTFLVDGVEAGDMEAVGGPPAYFDIDQFTEIQFGVGGPDVTKPTAGVSMNLVTKRGSNEFRGSARFYRTDDRFFGQQTTDTPYIEQPDSNLAPNQPSFVGNTVDQVNDYGFEAGGPVMRDRLWLWGSFAVQDYRNRTGGTTLEDVQNEQNTFEYGALKLNWQIANPNSFVGSWNFSDLRNTNRGAGLTRPPETTWNQRGPSAIYKFEDTHLFSSSFFLTGAYGKVDGGFSLTSRACVSSGDCDSAPETLWDSNGVWQRSNLGGSSSRAAEQVKLDGSYFFNTGETSHELKFGGRLREFEAVSTFSWPGGRNIFIVDLGIFGVPGNIEWAVGEAGFDLPPATTSYTSAWVQDTISRGRWTINAGLRYDLQEGRNEAVTSPGNDTFSDVLPDIDYAGGEAPFDWSTIMPRVGVTYALGEQRKTLLRGSYSQFAQQLSTRHVRFTNAAGLRNAYYYFLDVNENLEFDEGDVNLELGFCSGCPEDGTTPVSPNKIDPDFEPEIVSEGVLGVEHSLLPELVVSANYTYRQRSDINWLRPLIELPDGSIRAAVADDWQRDGTVSGPLPDGSTGTADVFSLRDSVSSTGGELQTTSDRAITYNGLGLTFTKRLSNQWMARGLVQYLHGEWNVPAPYTAEANPNPHELANDVDGALFGEGLAFSRRSANVFLQSSWTWNLNGMYQFAPDRPYGFNVAANLFGRQGYPLPYYLLYNARDGLGTQNISTVSGDLDRFRVDDIFTTDLRLEKELATTANLGFTFSIDIFNIFNSAYVMQRERRSGVAIYDWLSETLSPRVLRLGARLNWR